MTEERKYNDSDIIMLFAHALKSTRLRAEDDVTLHCKALIFPNAPEQSRGGAITQLTIEKFQESRLQLQVMYYESSGS